MWRDEPESHDSELDGKSQKTTRRKRVIIVMVALLLVSLSVAIVVVVAKPSMSLVYGTPTEISHDGYETTQKAYIPEIQADMVVYRHRQTKTEVLTLIPTDTTQDSVFAASFRTIPLDDSGVAHMLEHSVLDGSEKFPTKDPFNEMERGSLQTFLNAFTFADRTVYTVASRNRQDFNNLVSVYLDAVFRPLCVTKEGSWILRQEGWRIEENDDSTLELTGVVLSEMKGAYSDPDELIHRFAQKNLFPSNSYRFDSGGQPDKIPTLSHNDFRAFYEKFYHPTNAQLFFYGPLEHIQDGMEKAHVYLDDSDARSDIRQESRVEWQELDIEEPVSVREPYQSNDESDYRVMISWLINDRPMESKTEISWFVINELLMGTPTSKLEKALKDSGLGGSVLGDGLENWLQQWTFHVGLQGIESQEDVEAVEQLIMDTLDEVVTKGFTKEDVASAMNTAEFSLRELNSGDDPRGIDLLFTALHGWNYDRDPREALSFETALQELKDEVEGTNGALFVSMIGEHLLFNTHRVITELYPSATVDEDAELEEQIFLERLRLQLSEGQFTALLRESKQLAEIQATDDTPEALATIPSIFVKDINPVGDEYRIDTYVEADVLVAEHPVESSFGILYVDFGFDLSILNLDDVPLVPLLARLMLESGTSTLNDVQLARKIGSSTGGIEPEIMIQAILPSSTEVDGFVVPEGDQLETKLFFRGKGTKEQVTKLFALYEEILFDGRDFTQEKTLTILREMVADLDDSIAGSGQRFAARRIGARYNPHGYIREQLEGITHVQSLKEALATAKVDYGLLQTRLDRMKRDIITGHRNGMILNLTGEKQLLQHTQEEALRFVKEGIPLNPNATPFPNFAEVTHPWAAKALEEMPQKAPVMDEGIVTATSVSYVGEGGNLYAPGEFIDGSAAVITDYLETGYLYENLRLQRGAYGAYAALRKPSSGLFELLSYRDPNLVETLNVYSGIVNALNKDIASLDGLPEDALDAIIGTIGELDGSAPQPDELGFDSLAQYLRRETPAMRQAWRDQILGTNRNDYLEFAKRLNSMTDLSIAVVSSKAAIEEAKAEGIDLVEVSTSIATP